MSTKHSPPNNEKKNKKPAVPTEQSGTNKKRRSMGFIETSGFKPNWLETGPLTPEILQESLAVQKRDDPPENEAARVEVEPVIEEIASTEQANEQLSIEEEAMPAAPAADAGEEPPPATVAEQPEEWVQALFENDNATRNVESDASTAAAFIDEALPEPATAGYEDFIVEAEEVNRRPFEPIPALAAPAPEAIQPVLAQAATRGGRWTSGLLLTSLILLGLAAITFLINPFIRLALNSATLAQPAATSALAPQQAGSGNWCVSGDFLGGDTLRLADGGSQGDILASDNVFSLNYTVAQPGSYSFQVVDCDNPGLAYPETAAWLQTTQANQQVTFVFDTTGQGARLFSATPYVVSAIDGTNDFRVIGSFQEWDTGDASSQLKAIGDGLYQQVRRIAVPASHEAQFLAGEASQSIDSYGRTDDPAYLSFETSRPGEPVVFLLDTDRGQASVLYEMSPLLTSLAFGNGYRLLSYLLTGLAGLLLLVMAVRLYILNNNRLRMEHGCPQCRQQELMRISRRWQQRLLNGLGIPAYRYRCRNCTWEGTRISEVGEAFSPGALFTRAGEF